MAIEKRTSVAPLTPSCPSPSPGRLRCLAGHCGAFPLPVRARQRNNKNDAHLTISGAAGESHDRYEPITQWR
jgi:hypothetical protein